MSVKISDLTAATELANNDLLAIVDVSDTTMAASGTTKKVELFNIIPRTFIAQYIQDSLGDITQNTLFNTTGTNAIIEYYETFANFFQCSFTGVFDVYIGNSTNFDEGKNTVFEIRSNIDASFDLLGYVTFSYYIDSGNTIVYWYFLNTSGASSSMYSILGGAKYSLPEIKLFPTS
jgi:hypothetical protein